MSVAAASRGVAISVSVATEAKVTEATAKTAEATAAALVSATEAETLVSATVGASSVVALAGTVDVDAESTVGAVDSSVILEVASASAEVLEGGDAASAVLVTLVAAVGVLELLEVSVAGSDTSDSLDISGVTSIVGDATGVVVVVLVSEVVVVGTVVPCAEVVGPAAIAVVGVVLIAVRVVAWGVAEGVSGEANNVADIARGVLVALVANASLLLAVVRVVVAGNGVQGHVDLARVVAPFVINSLLGVPVVVGAPLVPCVVNPLVVALALVSSLSVGVVGIDAALETSSVLAAVAQVTIALLVAVVLVVNTVGAGCRVVISDISSLPGLNTDESSSQNKRLEHIFCN